MKLDIVTKWKKTLPGVLEEVVLVHKCTLSPKSASFCQAFLETKKHTFTIVSLLEIETSQWYPIHSLVNRIGGHIFASHTFEMSNLQTWSKGFECSIESGLQVLLQTYIQMSTGWLGIQWWKELSKGYMKDGGMIIILKIETYKGVNIE